ncbi:MAG: hypothetical protein ACYC1M_13470 [Armatimonadota bacterium]
MGHAVVTSMPRHALKRMAIDDSSLLKQAVGTAFCGRKLVTYTVSWSCQATPIRHEVPQHASACLNRQ